MTKKNIETNILLTEDNKAVNLFDQIENGQIKLRKYLPAGEHQVMFLSITPQRELARYQIAFDKLDGEQYYPVNLNVTETEASAYGVLKDLTELAIQLGFTEKVSVSEYNTKKGEMITVHAVVIGEKTFHNMRAPYVEKDASQTPKKSTKATRY